MIQNYPQNYIGNTTRNPISSNSVEEKKEESKVESTPTSVSVERKENPLVKKLNRVTKLLRDIDEGKTKASEESKRQLRNQKKIYEAQLKKESKVELEAKPSQTISEPIQKQEVKTPEYRPSFEGAVFVEIPKEPSQSQANVLVFENKKATTIGTIPFTELQKQSYTSKVQTQTGRQQEQQFVSQFTIPRNQSVSESALQGQVPLIKIMSPQEATQKNIALAESKLLQPLALRSQALAFKQEELLRTSDNFTPSQSAEFFGYTTKRFAYELPLAVGQVAVRPLTFLRQTGESTLAGYLDVRDFISKGRTGGRSSLMFESLSEGFRTDPIRSSSQLIVQSAILEVPTRAGINFAGEIVGRSPSFTKTGIRESSLELVGVKGITPIERQSMFLPSPYKPKGILFELQTGGELGQISLASGKVSRSLGVPEFKLKQPEYNEFVVQGEQSKISKYVNVVDVPSEKVLEISDNGKVKVVEQKGFELFKSEPSNFQLKSPKEGQKTLGGTEAFNYLTKSSSQEVFFKRFEQSKNVRQDYTFGIDLEGKDFQLKSPKEGQKTLEGKPAVIGFQKPSTSEPINIIDSFEVKDSIPSAQQQIIPQKIIEVSDTGELSIKEGFKLQELKSKLDSESTSLKSTQFYSEKERASKPLDTLSEGVGSGERLFEGLDFSGKKKNSNIPELVLIEEPVGKIVNIKSKEGLETIKVKIPKEVEVIRQDSNLIPSIATKEANIIKGIGLSKSISVTNQINVQNQKQINIQSLKLNQVQLQQQSQIQQQRQVQLQQQSQIQKQSQIQLQRQITTPVSKKITNITPPPNEPITPSLDFDLNPKSKKKQSKSRLFVRKKGKFEFAGEFDSPELASSRGKSILKDTLRASYKVEQEGKTLSALNLDNQFTRSKKDFGVVVQKREFRLGSFGERRDIQSARRLI